MTGGHARLGSSPSRMGRRGDGATGRLGVPAGYGAIVLLSAAPASGAEVCGTIAEFNAAMVTTGGYVEEVTVDYDVVGVNPADFPGTKGSLGQMRYTGRDLGGQDAAIKVYGPEDPPNASHPTGTLKMEYGNAC